MQSIRPIGREAAGSLPGVLEVACMLIAGLLLWCTAAGAAEPQPLQTAGLPQLRLEALQSPMDAASPATRSFGPARVSMARPRHGSVRFYDSHLIPELRSRFAGMGSVYQNMPGVGSELEQFTLYAEVTDAARRGLERATTTAMKDFVLDWSRIEERCLSIPLGRRLSSAVPGAGGRSAARSIGDLGLSFGISSRMPQLGLRYRLRETVTRFEVDGRGSVDVEFSRSADVYTRIAVKYDARKDWYGLYYRARF